MWYTREYYSAFNRKEILIHATISVNLENIMPSKSVGHKSTNAAFHLYEHLESSNS